MKITDQDIAKVLNKTVEEITEVKIENPALYEVLVFGVMCQKLSLSEEDLERYQRQLEKEAEK